jgi:hypothetical protein
MCFGQISENPSYADGQDRIDACHGWEPAKREKSITTVNSGSLDNSIDRKLVLAYACFQTDTNNNEQEAWQRGWLRQQPAVLSLSSSLLAFHSLQLCPEAARLLMMHVLLLLQLLLVTGSFLLQAVLEDAHALSIQVLQQQQRQPLLSRPSFYYEQIATMRVGCMAAG